MPVRRTVWWPGSGTTRRARSSVRCCSGLFDDEGRLHHVGVSASFTAARRKELLEELAPLRENAADGHPWLEWLEGIERPPHAGTRVPGGISRWTGGKDLSWEPLRPELVVEVGYDAMEGDRFRHTAQFRRWRPDRTPESCTYEQLERPLRFDVDDVLAGTPYRGSGLDEILRAANDPRACYVARPTMVGHRPEEMPCADARAYRRPDVVRAGRGRLHRDRRRRRRPRRAAPTLR